MADENNGGNSDNGGADDKTNDTILNANAGADGQQQANGKQPDSQQQQNNQQQNQQVDWRARLAGEDKEALKRLGRFTDEAAFYKSYRSLEAKLSSGEMKKALPEGASPEEVATWRKENGIPDKPEGYVEKLALPNGLVIGEADKPIVAEFAAAALEGNTDPAAFNKMVAKYYEIQDKQRQAQEDADASFKQSSEEALREVWQGADYRRNLTAVNNLLAGWPDGLAASILAGRDPEGRKFGDNPNFIKQLASLALELNPAATLVPVGASDPGKSIEGRLADITAMMPDRNSEYWKGPKAELLQQEYRDLIDAQEKLKSRAA